MPIEYPLWLPMAWLVIPLAVVWSMAWKGVALWKAGRNAHLAWFIVMFIFNTLGILPIIYIFAFSRKKE
jgi:methionyl-tRNA synthetase